MANNHNVFEEFNNIIKLSKSKRDSLLRSRRDLRRKIRKYFKEQKSNEIQPKFAGQGSFPMDIAVNPIPREIVENGEKVSVYYYDVDDGIYFIGNTNAQNRTSVQTYHKWIVEAVDGHTNTPPIDKNTCVRVLFSDGHNIDFPIYYKQYDCPELAHKAKGWVFSDPQAFVNWFNERADANPQIRRLVRYIKAWCDYREFTRTDKKMPSGLVLTILIVNNFYSHDRDDIALKETMVNIEYALSKSFSCNRPTPEQGENLLSSYNNKDYFMNCLSDFITNAKEALKENNGVNACTYWQKNFGDRFPCHLAKNETGNNIATVGLITGASTNRPWGLKL